MLCCAVLQLSYGCIPDCSKAVKSWITERGAKRAVVVGGGFIGIEMVENLVHRGLHVTLVEMQSQVGPGMRQPVCFVDSQGSYRACHCRTLGIFVDSSRTSSAAKGVALCRACRKNEPNAPDSTCLLLCCCCCCWYLYRSCLPMIVRWFSPCRTS